MAGTISLSLQQQFHRSTGLLLSGGRLDIFQAGTISTRQNAFRESSLVNPYSNPIVLESDARIPHLWLADGGIKIRLSDTTGIVQFESDNLPVIGSSGGGGGVDTTDPNSILSTGDVKWRPTTGTLAGFVRVNARSIGNAVSGATERANADTEQLFLFLYANFGDTICPVSGGRTGNSAADFAAGKNITLLDMRGRGAFGVADMGNSAINRIKTSYFDSGNNTTGSSTGGQDDLPISQPNLPNVNFTGTAASNSDSLAKNGVSSPNTVGNNFIGLFQSGSSPESLATISHVHNVTVASGGSGTAFETVPPLMIGTWYMRL